jgi:hypothetical protein
MRLGQLARKLALRPSQLVDFLATKQINLEEGSNARLQDEHVTAIVTYFAPDRLQEIVNQSKEEVVVEVTPEVITPEPIELKETIEEVVAEAKTQEPQEVELIKAPKVELTGLKVLGKIELPEPKKKEELVKGETSNPEEQKEKNNSRPPKRNAPSRTDRQPNQRPWQNPIALQREREAREAEEKRKEALEREKERKRMHYLSKVKTEPTKVTRVYDEPKEVKSKVVVAPPKTLWGKFVNWLNN